MLFIEFIAGLVYTTLAIVVIIAIGILLLGVAISLYDYITGEEV